MSLLRKAGVAEVSLEVLEFNAHVGCSEGQGGWKL